MHRAMFPISDRAVTAAFERYWTPDSIGHDAMRDAIQEFLRVAGFQEQCTNMVSDTEKVKRRIVGPWYPTS